MSGEEVKSDVLEADCEVAAVMEAEEQQSVTVADTDTSLPAVDQNADSADNEGMSDTAVTADSLLVTTNSDSVQQPASSAVGRSPVQVVGVPVIQSTSGTSASVRQPLRIVSAASSAGQMTAVPLATKNPGFVLCQVTSGGQAIILPRSAVSGIQLSSGTVASATTSATSVPVIRSAIPLQTVSSGVQGVTLTSASATAAAVVVTQPSAGVRLMRQAADGVRVIAGTNGAANPASLGVMLNRGAAPQRLAVAIAPANNTLRSVGPASIRLVAIRNGTPVAIGGVRSSSSVVASPQIKLLTSGVPLSGVRRLAPVTAGVTTVASSISASANTVSAVRQQTAVHDVQAYLRRIEELKSSQSDQVAKTPVTLAATVRTPLKAKTVLPTVTSAQQQQIVLLQSGSSISATQLGNVLRASTASTQGTALYMLTNSQLSSASLTAAIARAKVASSSGIGRPKMAAVGSLQAIRPSVSGSSAIIVDARHTVALRKAEQNQTKADRIVAEAIAKAQAEGISVESVADEADCKKKRRKKPGEVDGEEAPPAKKKRPPRPRTSAHGRKGLKDDLGDEMIADVAADGLAVSEECEVLTSDVADMPKLIARGGNRSLSKLKSKKRRPLLTFLKTNKRRKGGSDSDLSEKEMTPSGSGIDEDTLQLLQTRRSCRVTKRKKYVDDLDIQLSDEDRSGDEESVVVDANDYVNGIPMDQPQRDIFVENPAEEDAQIVEKILAMRRTKKKVVNQRLEVTDDGDDIDIEGGDDKKEAEKKAMISSVEEVEVEEFFVKYKNFSHLHCDWRTADELLLGDKRILSKIKRYKLKRAQNPYLAEVEEEEPFNPDYVEVERVLDVAVTNDPDSGEEVTHYLVCWRCLAYEDSTWELEQDVDTAKIKAFSHYRHLPPLHERQYKPRPNPKDWKQITEIEVYKNDNTLRDYQLEGLNWLTFSYCNRQNCILADEMGLGKTIQSITFLQEVVNYGVRGPFVIVVPLSTLGNWQREFDAWTDLNAIVYHGTQISRNMLREYEMYYKDELGNRIPDVYKFHALITTYEVIISDLEELSAIDWRVAIIDEAHRLKNRNCKLLQGLSCFEMEHRVLLTGTPLQNNVDELFSLLSFLEPRQFSSSEAFMAEFGRLETESQVDKLKALLKPMMLRRLKEDVEKTLASKEETIIEVELTNIQKKYYRAILERNFSFLAKGGTYTNLPNLMNTMMELRKCCNHPYLINGAEEQILEDAKAGSATVVLDAEKLFSLLVQSSGKLVLVDKLLPKLKAGGHKILIFSQMIRVLDIIEDYLIHRHYLYERIDGRIRGNLRQEAIDRFCKPDSDRFVFLLCTRAGGLGINLTAADTVIIFDSDWNPQNDIQAQARCHRIGQLRAVKVYRLITGNTYEREMFDKASLKLGLDKAVLQSMGNKELSTQNQLSKKEVEDLLKKGAYGALMEDDRAGEKFCEEDIEHILQQRTHVRHIESGVKGSTFAKASFNMSTNRSDINIDDPQFWQKWAKKAEIDVNGGKSDLIMDVPRQRKMTSRYGKHDSMLHMSDLDSSNSDDDDLHGRVKKAKRKKRQAGREVDGSTVYTRAECFKVEKNLLVFGWGRWDDIYRHACFKRKLGINDVIAITRAMLLFSLKHYEGDERIKKFILDLISPSEDGQEKSYKNHSGLSAPVPRGRKGRKAKKDVARKAQFEEDLTKLDIDVDAILVDDGYKKHLVRQSNKVLLRVRLLYYLKQEVIGQQADKIFSGAAASEIDVPLVCSSDADMPVYWWDAEADKCLLVGVFKHGYEKFNLMRQDPCLCFLARCGPPDGKAVLAEQNDDEEMKDDEDEEMEETIQKRRGRRKKKKKMEKVVKKEIEMSEDVKLSEEVYEQTAEEGKLPFPSASDLNTRFRRIITGYQRTHKQGMLKLEQISKKMHRREHRRERDHGGSDEEDYPPPSPSRLPSLGLDGVSSNPLLLAEQLHWTRREEADFYRVVSTFGVERDCETGQFIWDKFRMLARLERKLDNTLTEYFRAFYHMCLKVCRRFASEEDARPPNGLYVLPITEERANRCLARIDLLNKIREQILWHPWLDARLALCQAGSYLPQWWICGQHDKDLLIGAAKHGVSHTETNILTDPQLSFAAAYKQYMEHLKELIPECGPTSGHGPDAGSADQSDTASTGHCATSVGDKIKEELDPVPDSVKAEPEDAEAKKHIATTMISVDADATNINSTAQSESDAVAADAVKQDSSHVKSEDLALKEEDDATENDEQNADGKQSVLYWNYHWPKDRIIFYRLEHICYCVETGRWRMSHRSHHSDYGLASTPNASVPGTPGSGSQDYSVEETDGLKVTFHKRRHRRSKAEMEAERISKWRGEAVMDDLERSNAGNQSGLDDSSYTGDPRRFLEGGETPPYSHKKPHRVRRPKIDDNLTERCTDPDSRVPVVNNDGQILTGDDAPLLRELDVWLEEHPTFTPLSEVMGTTVKPVYRRRQRVDPSKLAVDQLTGDENVTVVNRNTGKRITGAKAPTLRNLQEWLIRNPGFDVDAKWAHIVHKAVDLPADMQSRILQRPSELVHTSTGCVDPAVPLSATYNYGRTGSELLNSYFDPTGLQQSFKMLGAGHVPVNTQTWDGYPEDDDYSDDGNSDRESLGPSAARQQLPSHLLPTSLQSPMFTASRPYLCSSWVIDRMCATFGQQSNTPAANLDRFVASFDQLAKDSRTGGIIHPPFAVPSIDNSSNLNSFVDADPLEGERVLFDGEVEHLASDDEPFRDTESQSPIVEEDSWQCVVEDGEVELT